MPHYYLCVYDMHSLGAFRGGKKQFTNWTKIEFHLKSSINSTNSRLQFTTTKTGVLWLDQVSVMPSDTYMVISSLCFYPLRFGGIFSLEYLQKTCVYFLHRTQSKWNTKLVQIDLSMFLPRVHLTYCHYIFVIGTWFSEGSCFYVGRFKAPISQISRSVNYEMYVTSKFKLYGYTPLMT
jgi:hypothetical protein